MFERIFICKDQPCFVFYPFNPWGHHLYSIISCTQGGEALFVTITAFTFKQPDPPLLTVEWNMNLTLTWDMARQSSI